jgi:transporter family-2 protein
MTSQLIYIVLAPKLGTTLRFSLVVTGQMAVLLVLNYYGLLGLPVKSIDWQHLLGIALLITGVLLIRKF